MLKKTIRVLRSIYRGFNRISGELLKRRRNKPPLISNIPGMAYRCRFDHEWTMEYVSDKCFELTGYHKNELLRNKVLSFNDLILPQYREHLWKVWDDAVRNHKPVYEEYKILTADNQEKWVWEQGIPVYDFKGKLEGLEGLIIDITDRRKAEFGRESAFLNLEKRMKALENPVEDSENITFETLFDLDKIQKLQDEFAEATGVASIITCPDGTPITKPSNFCRLCEIIIRGNEKGVMNCHISDAMIGRQHPEGPIVQKCLSAGLWDAGASITVGEKHIANWLIGEVRDENQDSEGIREYARIIGADEDEAADAYSKTYSMPLAKFKKIAQVLFTLANQISDIAWQNWNQAKFISDLKIAEDQRENALETLKKSEAKNKALLQALPDMMFLFDREGVILDYHAPDETLLIAPPEIFLGHNIAEVSPGLITELTMNSIETIAEKKETALYSYKIESGGEPWFYESRMVACGKYFLAIVRDITERRKMEHQQEASLAEKEKLQAMLTQSQKMESVGRLAGGVAHDFNNMLSVILGHSELMLEQIDSNHIFYMSLKEIKQAAERSAALTRQLLAFARKQSIAPKILNLNKTVEGMLSMMKRLIGENIRLSWKPGEKLWNVKVDISQINQILANLCVNSRDAINGSGEITIETSNTILDSGFTAAHPGFSEGAYVKLAVSDNGCGIKAKNLENLFEPFFTTKVSGKGTGLGLATVYGIVKQNNGFIDVSSQPGTGSTFTIFLPRVYGKNTAPQENETQKEIIKGIETILLVEDETAILEITAIMLKNMGYNVISSSVPEEALSLAEKHAGEINLLITDVIMPGINGRDLSEKILALSPDMKCLFISGYTADVIASQGILNEGIQFIQKPFSMNDLSNKIRIVLES